MKDGLDIDFWAAGGTYTQIRKAQSNQFVHKFEDLFPRRWDARSVGALVECVNNYVSRTLGRMDDHFFETFCHCPITGLLNSIVVRGIKPGEYVATWVRASSELNEERWEQVAASLLIGIPKIAIEIRDRGISRLAQCHYVSYDCGAKRPGKCLYAEVIGSD